MATRRKRKRALGFFDWFRKSAKPKPPKGEYCVFGVSYTGGPDQERCGLTEKQARSFFAAAKAQAKRTGDVNMIAVEKNGKQLRCPYWEDDRTDRNCG